MDSLELVDYSKQEVSDRTIGGVKNEYNVIVGCGGVGYWTGLLLAMLGAHKFMLIDADKIDNTNLARIPVPQTWIGTNKAVALRKMIRSIRPSAQITVISSYLTEQTFPVLSQLLGAENASRTIWDTTDDARIQVKIYEYCKGYSDNIRYAKLGYEGWEIGSYADYSIWIPDDYRPGYRTNSANVLSSVCSAALGILSAYTVDKDVKVNLLALIENGGFHEK